MFNENNDKKRKGMLNFGEETEEEDPKDEEDTKIEIPDDVFEQISMLYFETVYTKHTEQLKKLCDELEEVKGGLLKLSESVKETTDAVREIKTLLEKEG